MFPSNFLDDDLWIRKKQTYQAVHLLKADSSTKKNFFEFNYKAKFPDPYREQRIIRYISRAEKKLPLFD
jgi:hypothetical protein